MLFLNRPRQTWMPWQSPHAGTQQYAYNQQLQQQFQSTRRVAPAIPAATPPPAPPQAVPSGQPQLQPAPRGPVDALRELGELHASGVLTDDEFTIAKSQVLGR